ncbi:type II secretion system protein [Bacillus sp. FJAT-45037]|uniref:type II secretion system protein n=1 Tax=Bacillus sp. FJAT-45037 TaxID=2011007 RepID=UPI000C24249F|nr:type II secretion system protein [Bacillus sp. FJAT-45037]
MIKKQKNEKGYALILVLLTITMIGIFIPVLLSNLLSNANQFKLAEENLQRIKLEDMAQVYINKSVNLAVNNYIELISSENPPTPVPQPVDYIIPIISDQVASYEISLYNQSFLISEPVINESKMTFSIFTVVQEKQFQEQDYLVELDDFIELLE